MSTAHSAPHQSDSSTHTPPAAGPRTLEVLRTENRRYRVLVAVAILLTVILLAELVLVSLPSFGGLIPIVLYALLVVKFTVLLIWFMHLRWEKLIITAIFLSGIILGGGTVAALLLIFSSAP